jgi:hypothetical protein
MANHAAVTIPLENIQRVRIYINSPRKTVAQIKEATGADYILNGTLYNLKTGAVNCHLKVDGKVITEPDYTVEGYGWNEGPDISMLPLPCPTENYIACTPLIVNGKKEEPLTYDAGQGGSRGRSALGMKSGRLALYCTKDGSSAARTPEELRDDLFAAGWDSAIMLDGGGSAQCDFAGEKITNSRKVQHLILVYLKKNPQEEDPTMTEKEIRNQVVTKAKSFLGCKESDGSHKKIIDLYNNHKPLARGYAVKYTDEWCATFVSAIGLALNYTDIMPTECSCTKMIDLYKAKGRWMEKDEYVPSPGDIVMYDWQDNGRGDNTGTPDHVGFVVSLNGTTMTIIEGNKGEAVSYRALSVNGKYIRGYCLPDYTSKATKLKQANTDVLKTTSVNLPVLKNGSSGAHVRTLQMLLNGNGYSSGTVDGDFGPNTEKAVRAFQKAKNLIQDGLVGQNTWTAILGV